MGVRLSLITDRTRSSMHACIVTPGCAVASEPAFLDHVTGSARRVSVAFAPSPCLLAYPPTLADATGMRLFDNRQPTSRTTRATARSRVPVRIYALAGDTYYTPYRFILGHFVCSITLFLS